MLGVPPEDRVKFKDWSDDISALVFGALEDPDRHARAQSGMSELVAYIEALLERVRAEPGDDLASALVQARRGDGTRKSVGWGQGVPVSGHPGGRSILKQKQSKHNPPRKS